MKRAIITASVLAAAMTASFATGAAAHTKHHTHHQSHHHTGGTVTVSCFRGPWKDVIWDRPNAVFIDSLVAIGYDFPTAHAIGERICRDAALVGNTDRLRNEAIRVLRESPAHRAGRVHRH